LLGPSGRISRVTKLQGLLDVERLEVDIFRGASPPTKLQRLFGGQVAGQALVAATRTAPQERTVHSLHGYFLNPGRPDMPVLYMVERLKDGRAFSSRRVSGIQDGRVIFNMAASFQVAEEGPEHQDEMPAVTPPEDLIDVTADNPELGELHRLEWPGWDLRRDTRTPAGGVARQNVWLRYREPLPDDPTLHICALAYASDLTLLGSALVPHPGVKVLMASLDHAMWFLRPFRADDWLLYAQTSPSAGNARGLTQGQIFDRSGRLVAATVQEGLVRFEP
jgi:acyl-CoA thioesterase-2